MQLKNSGLARSIVSGLFGFLAYGGWAFYANYAHGVDAATKAAFTQGSYSFTVTLVMTLLMESLFRLLSNPALSFCTTFFVTCTILYSSSWGINVLAGTPEILMTILPGIIIGTVYTFVYTLSLARLQVSQ
ncbi:MAG: hypothetical protein ACR2P1_14775 [Pseudomonadales bacterium]